MADMKGAAITWLGHSTALITTSKGTQILIDPFIDQNPKYPQGYKLPETIDLVLLTHGHGDHIADVVPVAKKHGSQVVGMVEVVGWVQSKGVDNVTGMNLGGTYKFKDVSVSLVKAHHSSSIQDGDKTLYAGEAGGFVIAIEDGPVIYHAGDTSLFSDMQLIRELHAPEIGMLPIGDHYTMGPKAASLAAKYLGLKTVIPIHYGTWPLLAGTPEELSGHLQGTKIEVLPLVPGKAAL